MSTERSEVDRVMHLDPIELSGAPQDIDIIIAYHRRNRLLADSGVKLKRPGAEGPKKSLAELGLGSAASAPVVRRRKLT